MRELSSSPYDHPARLGLGLPGAGNLRTVATRSPPGLYMIRARSHVLGAAGSRGEELAMGMRLRRQDPAVPGTPAAPAAQPTRGSSIARTLRTAWQRDAVRPLTAAGHSAR